MRKMTSFRYSAGIVDTLRDSIYGKEATEIAGRKIKKSTRTLLVQALIDFLIGLALLLIEKFFM